MLLRSLRLALSLSALLITLCGCGPKIDSLAGLRRTLEADGWHVPRTIRDDWQPGTILLAEEDQLSMFMSSAEVCPTATYPPHRAKVVLPTIVIQTRADDTASATFFGSRLRAQFEHHRASDMRIRLSDTSAEYISIPSIDEALQQHSESIHTGFKKGTPGKSSLWVITETLVAGRLESTVVRTSDSALGASGNVTSDGRIEGDVEGSRHFVAFSTSDDPMVIGYKARRISLDISTMGTSTDISSHEGLSHDVDRLGELPYRSQP